MILIIVFIIIYILRLQKGRHLLSQALGRIENADVFRGMQPASVPLGHKTALVRRKVSLSAA